MTRLTLSCAILLQAGLPSFAQADPLSEGRRMAEMFFRGETGAIWTASTPEMQQAFGSQDNLATIREDVSDAFGTEEQILSERVENRAGHDVFTRISRWSNAPAPLEMVIAFDEAERIAGFFIRQQPVAADSSYLDHETRATLRLPVEGEWFVYWGGRTIEENYHAADAGQRFALDLLIMRDGQSYAGDPASPESYHCWGHPILAPAVGVVMQAVDGLPDQAIGTAAPENPAGNHVVIDFGEDEYGFLAHLQQGSIRVAKGDHVTAGQMIGLCGNSGNTSEPHLHFHMQTTPILGRGEGLPAQFTNFLANDVPIERGEPKKGDFIRPAE